MTVLVNRLEQLERGLQNVTEPKPLLHPRMADVYREKIAGLREALEREDARPRAAEALRGLLDTIILEPEGAPLRIVVKGNLAAMLAIAHNAKRPSDVDDLNAEIAGAVKMVAGARNHRYRDLDCEQFAL